MTQYKLDTRDSREKFIHEMESNIYTGKNEDGEEVIIFLQQHEGMEIWSKQPNKPNWYEVIYVDAEGFQEGVSYTPTAQLEEIMEKRRVNALEV